jgi:hypothetical protein
MNRSVMDRQMFRNGGYVRQMQMGGDPMMAPPMGGDPMMAPPMAGPAPQGMPPAPSVAGMPVPADASMDQAAAGAMQQGIDPAMLESMLQQAAGQFGNLDAAAETGDYEQVMNVIRGDQASLQDRRQELAGVVGDADAAQTPDSVLTLVQPIMQLAAVDQGIGGLAPETMNTPVTGDMAGGIMSTVNMGAEEQPMPGQGGPAPVNFNQGGAVQYFAPGGVAMPNERQQQLFNEKRALYGQLIDPTQQAADLEEQKKMTQAQMLFDIAQGGLLFASGAGKPGGTPAEQLAAAFVQPLGNIGARAGELEKFEQGQKREERALNLQALGAVETTLAAEQAAAAKAALQKEANTFAASESRLDRAYKIKLALDKLAANATRLGSEAKTSAISYLTDPDRLDKYANGTLGDDATTFEQLVLDYIDPKNNEVYDAALGRYVKGSATQLAPRVLAAIQKGNPTFYSTIAGQLNLDPSGGGVGTPPEPEAPKTLGQATSQIFSPDGTVNKQSNVWSLTKPIRVDENIDYGKVIGLSRVYPGLISMASEGYAELVDGVPSEAAQRHKKAQATLTAFANDMLQFSTNLQGDRVLKFVQELIEKETKNLRPGGLLFKTNADAVATLEALRDGFGQAMQIEAAKLTEYGGNSSGYRENQVTSARARMDQMKVLYNEIRAFERGFASPAKGAGAVQKTEGDQSLSNARSQLLKMKKN